ncbi:MAG: glycosyltransferase [Pseudomonadota bacterium]
MRRLKILTWHTHGNYLYYLSQAPHDFYVLSKAGRPPGYGGRCARLAWGANVIDMPVQTLAGKQFDCILFQGAAQYEKDQYELLSPAQRALPAIYLEHDTPRLHPTDQAHPVNDTNVLLVHVTAFNALMWSSGRTPTTVIEHGVTVPADIGYRGGLARGLVVMNHLARRGRRLGADLFLQARAALALDLVGAAAKELGGLGEVEHAELADFSADYRFLFHPARYSSLSLSVVEAMMIGMPVVALATTEMNTVIEHGVSGFIDTNPLRLHEHMRTLLAQPALARELGARARLRARERFHIGRFCAEWDAALRHVTGTVALRAGR